MYRKKYMLALLCTLSVSAVFAGGCANRKEDAKRLIGSASSQTSSESVAVSDAETVSDAVSAAEEPVNAPESAVSLAEDAVIWTSSSPESADVLLADSEEDIIIDDSDSTDDIIIDDSESDDDIVIDDSENGTTVTASDDGQDAQGTVGEAEEKEIIIDDGEDADKNGTAGKEEQSAGAFVSGEGRTEKTAEEAIVGKAEASLIDDERIAEQEIPDPSKTNAGHFFDGKGFDPDLVPDEENVSESVTESVPEEVDIVVTDSEAESAAESVAESATESVAESAAESAAESVAERATESVAESVLESAAESVTESVAESAAESVAERATEFVAESVAESEAESVAESVAESAAESVAESEAESVAESVAESEAESVAESAAESAAESVAESAVESTAESVPAASEEMLIDHVKGIKEFSVIEGMQPDVMAGITWDETIASVEPDTNGVDWMSAGEKTLRYLITAADGRQEIASITVRIYPDLDLSLYGMEGDVVIETGGDFDPMENITWDDEIASVTADTSALNSSVPGIYLISYTLTAPDGRTQSTVRQVTVSDGSFNGYGADYSDSIQNYSTVTDLGLWRLTAYMDTPADQGPYVGQTASGAPLVAGRTVAVSQATCARLGLSFGDHLMIDGHIYVLEDYGGSAMNDQNWADIFVDNPADEYSDRFNRYTEVYLLR